MNKSRMILAVVAILIIVALVLFGSGKMKKTVGIETNNSSPRVASVNGTAITRLAFDTQLAATVSTFQGQGVDVKNPEILIKIKTQVLSDLISNELVLQGAIKAGTIATDEEVEAQFQTILNQTGGVEKLKAQLVAVNLTEQQLRANIAKQLVVQKYLLQNIDLRSITVSDEEVVKFYDENTKGQKNVPALKTVSDQIKQQLTNNKQQALIASFVNSLREKAQIETSN